MRPPGNRPHPEAVLLAMLNTQLSPRPVVGLLGLSLLFGACGSGTPVVPSPTGSPVDGPSEPAVSPGPSGTPAPSAPPTSEPPTAEPSSATGEIDHPTEPTAIVLRMEQGGGFVPIEFNVTSTPQFTLYGDGTVIYQPVPDPDRPFGGPSFTHPPLQTATMSPEQVDELLRFALTQGRLADARAQYEDNTVADAPTTTFSIDAGGYTKSVSIYALSETIAQQDQADRAGFLALAESLRDFGAQVERGNATDTGRYEPERYRAFLIESPGQVDPLEWPWDDLTLDDFTAAEEFSPLSTVITAEQALEVIDEPYGGVMSVSVEAPDGTGYSLNLRPLLPEEEE